METIFVNASLSMPVLLGDPAYLDLGPKDPFEGGLDAFMGKRRRPQLCMKYQTRAGARYKCSSVRSCPPCKIPV